MSFLGLRVVNPQSPLTFCDLVRNPEKYNGEEITVRATYRYGFEWSQLYCLDCAKKGKAWLDTGFLDDASARSLKRAPKYKFDGQRTNCIGLPEKGQPPASLQPSSKYVLGASPFGVIDMVGNAGD